MAIHSSTLARRTPWTEEPGGILSTESQNSWVQQWLNNKYLLLAIGGCWWDAGRLLKIFNYLFGSAGSSLQHVKSNSLTKDWTPARCTGSASLGHWTIREVPGFRKILKRRWKGAPMLWNQRPLGSSEAHSSGSCEVHLFDFLLLAQIETPHRVY